MKANMNFGKSQSPQSLLSFYSTQQNAPEYRDDCRHGLWMSLALLSLLIAGLIFAH